MKKVFFILRNIFEVYLPVTTFIAMFVMFIVQVFFRYVIRHPLTWSMEIIVIGFIWTVEFGACYTMRNRAHVKFTMIYDRLKPKSAAVTRMVGNLIIFLTFLCLIPSSWAQGQYESFQKTAALRIPYTFMFLPFVFFLFSIACYSGAEIIEDIKVLRGIIPDSKDHSDAIKAVIDAAEAKK